jgi:N-acetylated-alpha-linked acidic dipeptidase
MRALAAWLAASALASLGAAFAAGGESAAPFGFNAADEKEVVEEKARDARLAAAGGDLPIGALGSGSDYTPFLQHLGITTLSIEYRGEDDDAGIYHSDYDSFDHYVRFGDPTFAYGVAEAQTVGHSVLRMADAPVLPLQFTDFAETMGDYVEQLRVLLDEKRHHSRELSTLIEQNAFGLVADPRRPVAAPAAESAAPQVDFGPLDSAVRELKRTAHAYDDAYARLTGGELSLDARHRNELNALLQSMEHRLTDPRGLPGRDWFKHLVYAPGRLTGYAVKTLPGVREAIEGERWDEANAYVAITANALTAYARALEQATGLLVDRSGG